MIKLDNVFAPVGALAKQKIKTFSTSSQKQTEKLLFSVFVSVDVPEGMAGRKKCIN